MNHHVVVLGFHIEDCIGAQGQGGFTFIIIESDPVLVLIGCDSGFEGIELFLQGHI